MLRWARERRAHPPVPNPPASAFPSATPAFARPRRAAPGWSVTWVGHSTLLLQLGAMNVLTDPMFSERASPVSFAGPRRMVPPGVSLDALPPIDLVLLSHNHYDHCDRRSVRAIARQHPAAAWIVPLGLAALVRRWGVREVMELDWWEVAEAELAGGVARVGCTPARHFSARGPFDRGDTLWCGFTIRANGVSAYFAGDTAMHPDFAAVGERLGPFDLVLMPVGAYEPRWFMQGVHVNAEEGVDAFRQVAGAGALPAMVPIHWGTFRLTDEDPLEPPLRARAHWRGAGLPEDRLWVLDRGETRGPRDQ
jgi:N-acyl-phosphatidylethanolamine-hydrolysing phospholipase D